MVNNTKPKLRVVTFELTYTTDVLHDLNIIQSEYKKNNLNYSYGMIILDLIKEKRENIEYKKLNP